MPDPAAAETTEQPIIETPAPLSATDSLSEFRSRRAEVDVTPGDEPAVEAKPAVEVKAEEAEPDPASEAGKALAAKKGSLQSRINELVREKGQTAAERESIKAERDALKAELDALKAGKPAEVKAESKADAVAADPNDPEPKIESFDDYEKYTRALARWEARQESKAIRAKDAEAQQAKDAAGARGRAIAAATDAHPDFQEKAAAYEAAGGGYSPVARDIILGHPLGHEFAYALVSNPEIAARINGAQSPMAAAMEAGAVLAEIKAAQTVKAEPKPKPVSKAPAPVEPLAGESSASTPDPAKMTSIAEFRKVRDKLIAA